MKALLLLALAASMLPGGQRNAPTGVAGADYSSLPTVGENSADSYVGNAWAAYTGSKRVSERSVMINQISNWGARGSLVNRTYDISSFEVSVDLTNIVGKTALIMTFGSKEGSYPTDPNHQLNFDFVSDSTDTTKYLITCSNDKGAHNTSISGFSDGQTWADDANFTGVTTTAADHIVNIRVEKTTEMNSTIYVNEVGFLVNNADLYKNFVDSTNSYITIGTINKPNAEVAYQLNYVGDASDLVYYGAEGNFTKVKEGIASINNNKADLFETIEGVLEVKETFDALPYKDLYLHDRNYFKSDYNQLKTEINTKLDEKGAEVYIKVFEKNVVDLEALLPESNTEDGIQAAIAKRNEAEESLKSIDATTLGSLQTTYDDLVARFETAKTTIKTNAPIVYRIKLDAFKTAVDNLASIQDMKNAFELKANLLNNLLSEMDEDQANALNAELDAANTILMGKTQLNKGDFTQGASAYAYASENDELGMLLVGNSMGVAKTEGSGLFLEEELAANNFTMEMNISNLPVASGSWMTFGLMEKPELFVFAESAETQNNKGIFFLLTRKNSTTISIQSFMISLTSNRFYDGALGQLLEIPFNENITFSIKEVKKTIAGVEDSYVDIRFNDQALDQEIIKASKLKTVYGKALKGYLMFGSSSASLKDPVVATVKSINGVSPFAQSHGVKENLTPTSTDSSKTFQLNTTSDVNYKLDTKGQAITEVKMDETVVAAENYTYADGTFTLKNSYLNTLTEGEHTIKVSTAEGSVSWTLTVVKGAEQPDDPKPTKKGCKGAALGTSLVISLLAAAGMGIAIKKKKED